MTGFGHTIHGFGVIISAAEEEAASGGEGLWVWGSVVGGRLGTGDYIANTAYSSPIQVGGNTDTWAKVVGGMESTFGVKTDGTLWAWGANLAGQLGLNNTTYYSSPVQVGALTNWSSGVGKIATGSRFALAIKTDGTLWSWGHGSWGKLGHGNQTTISSPAQVGSLTDWAVVSCGDDFTLAVKTDGTAWAWGNSSYGRTGLNTGTYYLSPVQIGALTNWATVDAGKRHAVAAKTDSTLWTWGHNNKGQIGDGSTTNRSSPVQIGALTTWSKVTGGSKRSLAIKTDGTLWGWGYNNGGQLGVGDTASRSSPVQAGTATDWAVIHSGMGAYITLGLTTGNTLWSWGHGSARINATTYSTPSQVGDLTSWIYIGGGNQHSFAIRDDS